MPPFYSLNSRTGGLTIAFLLRLSTIIVALEFKLPKEGRHYDWSEVVYVFEREADEDGYASVWVDDVLIKTFEEKQLSYEVSMMGQQVGRHTAVVRLMEYMWDEDEARQGNVELHNTSVTYTIATPGSMDMRASLSPWHLHTGQDPRLLAEADTLVDEAVEALKQSSINLSEERLARALDMDLLHIVQNIEARAHRARLVNALLKFAERTGGFGNLFGDSNEQSTVDVITSRGAVEACSPPEAHDLDSIMQRIHYVNPYEGFDAHGLDFTAGEHQGHDSSLMALLVHVTRPKLIIEVGSWKGGSAIQMASVIRKRGWGCRTKIICVDTWLGTSTDLKAQRLPLQNGYPTVYREFMNNIIQSGYSSVIIPIPAPANIGSKYLAYLQEREFVGFADLIFIDGNHDYDDVAADIRNYFPLLSPGGLMFGDDYGWAGVKKAVHEFANMHNLTVISPGGRTWFMA